ncbi:Vta1 like-domain-containing protein [Morchella snyderi]|nr:Vta1 like-domain-containing protein [Morchella snyderi]
MSGKSAAVREPPNELSAVKQYIRRGNQLRGADPVITYYCYFWAIKHILANSLHSQSPECTVWTTDLMDELERRKAALEGNELLTDDMAAQAYVENFALKIFNNGVQVIDANRATNQTADTLLAGATLLEVCQVFGDLDADTLKKIKYGKFHATRILKAIQAGHDPNPSKPATPEPAPIVHTEPPPDIYGNQHTEPPPDIYGNQHTEPPPDIYGNASRPPAPSIEEVPDESVDLEPRLARTSLHPTPPPAPQTPVFPSPPGSPKKTHEYLPEVPTVHEPSAPSLFPTTMGPANTSFPDISPYNPPQPPQAPYVQAPYARPPLQNPYAQPPYAPSPYSQSPPPLSHYHQAPTPTPAAPPKKVKKVTPEEMTKAQKHARWAISALDYEDVETAIAQFRLGLQLLGAE